jgi:hypothetical protein
MNVDKKVSVLDKTAKKLPQSFPLFVGFIYFLLGFSLKCPHAIPKVEQNRNKDIREYFSNIVYSEKYYEFAQKEKLKKVATDSIFECEDGKTSGIFGGDFDYRLLTFRETQTDFSRGLVYRFVFIKLDKITIAPCSKFDPWSVYSSVFDFRVFYGRDINEDSHIDLSSDYGVIIAFQLEI